MLNKNTLSLATFLVSALLCQSVHAEYGLRIGAGVSFGQNAYDQDSSTSAVPLVFYDGDRYYAEGSEAGVYAYKDSKNQWRVSVGYEGRNFDPSDASNAQLQQLDKRKSSANIGTSYMRITPYGGFKVQAKTDVLGHSDGTTVRVGHISRFKFANDRLTVYPQFGLQWNNDKYNDYYFGVSNDEASRTGLNAYQAGDSVNPYVNVSGNYAITPNVYGFFSQSLEFLSDEQKNSPLTDDKINATTTLGLMYQF